MTTTQYRIVSVLTALATLITAETTYAAGYAQRYQAASTAYKAHAHRIMDSVRAFVSIRTT